VEGGPAYRAAVKEFLQEYGWRANELDVAEPTWVEEPATPYKLIAKYARQDDADPEEELKSLAAARKTREELILSKISDGQAEGMFRMMLAGAQQYLPIQENHNFWIDQQGQMVIRPALLEAGQRLAPSGVIGNPDDLFYLHFDELQDALRDPKVDLSATAAGRRAERERFQALTPPQELGTAPPPEVEENPIAIKFFGAQPEQSADPRLINGIAASGGKVTATARVVPSLDEAERLRGGEVLVCPATMPPWTPLFSLASALVTDHGGVLSHTAIVAREYGLPAVVGTKVGTSLIRDGQKVTVDGDAGTVKLED
jgi:phosphohistidine swiveling domain-containing protein